MKGRDVADHVKAGGKLVAIGKPMRPPPVERAVPVTELVLHERCQMREHLDQGVLDEYAERYREQLEMPPIDVFDVDGALHVVDGFHRLAAVVIAGLAFVRARVVGTGTLDDAVTIALRANATHGLRRSSADVRRAIGIALSHPALVDASNRVLAEACGVSERSVRRVQQSIAEASDRLLSGVADQVRHQVRQAAPGDLTPRNHTSENSEIETGPVDRVLGADGKRYPKTRTSKVAPAPPEAEATPPPPVTAQPMPDPAAWTRAATAVASARRTLRAIALEYWPLGTDGDGAGNSPLASAISDLGATAAGLRQDAPEVCPTCSGVGCVYCRQRGWTTHGVADNARRVLIDRGLS